MSQEREGKGAPRVEASLAGYIIWNTLPDVESDRFHAARQIKEALSGPAEDQIMASILLMVGNKFRGCLNRVDKEKLKMEMTGALEKYLEQRS